MKTLLTTLMIAVSTLSAAAEDTWFDALVSMKEAEPDETEARQPTALPDFGQGKYTVAAWIKSRADGTIFAKTAPEGQWVRDGKSLFLRGGRLTFDVGWVGAVQGRTPIADGKWHHVAFCGASPQTLYVDGTVDGTGNLASRPDPSGSVFKIGYTSTNFAPQFQGQIDEVRVYGRVLSSDEISALAQATAPPAGNGLLGYWSFEKGGNDDSGGLNHAVPVNKIGFADDKFGKALSTSSGHLSIACGTSPRPDAKLWLELAAKYSDTVSVQEMEWERNDGIWGADWKTTEYSEAARRYASRAQRPTSTADKIKSLAVAVRTATDLAEVRTLYLTSRRYDQLLEKLSEYKLDELRSTINELYKSSETGRKLLTRLDAIEAQAARWQNGPPAGEIFERWEEACIALRMDATVNNNPLIDFQKIVFVKRHTYNSNHYYTEFINSRWMPGGNLCVLDLKSGTVTELVPELENGVFGRFDLDFDARHIVFAWKCANDQGYRIYEIQIDPNTGDRIGKLKQLTYPEEHEAEIVSKYRIGYHHGTDDMQPCYLPDGGIVFISTRCQYGILCDGPDIFTTTILYRMDRDGTNMMPLSNSSVSEASPTILPNGRIMYTRWEYLDKGAVSVKCLWAMNPDGSGSIEVYGNDISLPPTFLYGRPILNKPNQYVMLGTPHYPQNGMGTVIRLDMNKCIRTREPMTYMTPDVDIRSEGGFHFMIDGNWTRDGSGKLGRLFKEPYPLSDKFFLVPCKAAGRQWHEPNAYDICLLDETGNTAVIYDDPEMSCFLPFPLKPRTRPPVIQTTREPELAEENLATCVVTDIYHGMADTERGTIKYIRVLEQVPRPWAARRRWGGDCVDQQHATVSRATHLGLKVQHGVVPVEADGSAHFVVPAAKNISFQALDQNFMAVQTERTYVNYMPGETRSCIGCHETPNDVGTASTTSTVAALKRKSSVPGPQPGEESGKRPLDFALDVQPVLDRHCVECHGDNKLEGRLDLRGTLTKMFTTSYESLLNRDYLPIVGENHPKTGNVHYLPARSLGSHNSLLVAMLAQGKVKLMDQNKAKRAAELAEEHKDVALKPEELLKITNWVDTNGQFYGMYWGRKNLEHQDHPNFRPIPTFERAASYVSAIPEEER